MSLYDPCGSSEDGVIILKPEKFVEEMVESMDLTVTEWKLKKGGICLEQGGDFIALDAEQVEALYEILKHNR